MVVLDAGPDISQSTSLPATHITQFHLSRPSFRRHLIWVGRLSVVVGIVERLVPDELWELFQRV
ncbi:hypothetical protein ACF08N_37375, partial [Streptomyces sp. NPDC015127]|uniref:hypothetical protein n=1 Tax=Streptomyces sp. NPDC015127 TaxID=3364939 RepID=UPI0036FDC2AF